MNPQISRLVEYHTVEHDLLHLTIAGDFLRLFSAGNTYRGQVCVLLLGKFKIDIYHGSKARD
jgi:hypothetical protein